MITRYKVTSENVQIKDDDNTAVVGWYSTEIAAHNSAIREMKNFGYGATGDGQYIVNEYAENNFEIDGEIQTVTYTVALIDRQVHSRTILASVHILKVEQKEL